MEMKIFIWSNSFDGNFNKFELPAKSPATKEYAKFIGTFDGVM